MPAPAKIGRIGVLTSGGDAPGMNASLRAVVLAAKHHSIDVVAFRHGYEGLLNDDWQHMNESDVLHILQYSGTIIKSARSERFREADAPAAAAQVLDKHQIDALIVIGGDGSFRGAGHLGSVWQKPIVGIPGTIDNDLYGTDATIGYATAVETAMDALDKIRDTAEAMDRVFIVEVMGRHAGFIGLSSAMAAGAERMILPELQKQKPLTVEALVKHIENVQKVRGDSSYVMVLSENQWPGGAVRLAEQLEDRLHLPCRPCLLGHIQRGGRPTASDRILATRIGVHAVNLVMAGANQVMAGIIADQPVATPLADTWQQRKGLSEEMIQIQQTLFNPVKRTAPTSVAEPQA
ncbi:ATP-dependent 6-phosphofructokinase [Idiomarina xiamenensis]|uniref:6-phosphofructokinase n=1 Tax=Idiomarina xiamenensis 10-D-4 TaxID=740709 RepID=K2KCJ2_9GAMM|nr:ATP-dependent 6-phosphofructokinase [Idiomarina xiamenensis]EKE80499.1 6-phosphofructokinase [Idiomarina xiamenensis 10-D-4]